MATTRLIGLFLAGASVSGLQGCALRPLALAPQPVLVGAWATSTTDAYRGKRDDIHFADARTGFYGTGAGDLFRTDDGGATWAKLWSKQGTFIRADRLHRRRRTASSATSATIIPASPTRRRSTAPAMAAGAGRRSTFGGAIVEGICAIDVLLTKSIYQGELRDRAIIHAAGRVGGPAKLLRSVDGGESWTLHRPQRPRRA